MCNILSKQVIHCICALGIIEISAPCRTLTSVQVTWQFIPLHLHSVSWQKECHENLSIQNKRICCDYTVSGLALYTHCQLALQLLLPHSYRSLHQHIEALELVFVIGWCWGWRLLWVREVTTLLLLTWWSSRNFTTHWCIPEVCSRTHCRNLCLGRCILSEIQIIRPITNCMFCFPQKAWVKHTD